MQAGQGFPCCCRVSASELSLAVQSCVIPVLSCWDTWAVWRHLGKQDFTSSRVGAHEFRPLEVGLNILCAPSSADCSWLQILWLWALPFLPRSGHEWWSIFCSSDVLLSQFSPNFACFLFYHLLVFLFATLHLSSFTSLYCSPRLFMILFQKLRISWWILFWLDCKIYFCLFPQDFLCILDLPYFAY